MSVGSLFARGIWLVAGSMLLLASACADEEASGAAPRAGIPTAQLEATATPAATPTVLTLPTAVQAALALAASDAGTTPDAIELIEFHGENWSNAALGCPEPGKFYAQVVTPGYVVSLRVAGAEREYHTDLTGRVVSCDEAQE